MNPAKPILLIFATIASMVSQLFGGKVIFAILFKDNVRKSSSWLGITLYPPIVFKRYFGRDLTACTAMAAAVAGGGVLTAAGALSACIDGAAAGMVGGGGFGGGRFRRGLFLFTFLYRFDVFLIRFIIDFIKIDSAVFVLPFGCLYLQTLNIIGIDRYIALTAGNRDVKTVCQTQKTFF